MAFRCDNCGAAFDTPILRRAHGACAQGQSCAVCGKRGELTRCSRCKLVLYCSREHQTSHWKQHKPLCQPCAPVAVPESWTQASVVPVPGACTVHPVSGLSRDQVQASLAESRPLVFADFQEGWAAAHKWSFEYFAQATYTPCPLCCLLLLCLLYTSDAADEEDSVELGGRPDI
eukprot:TRINITY_DN7536_c0_g1_i2.p2 TRINITY_DN7536_c0_g1~~TRINITY_DN7536_c0_g1_i2.p2  ORF type:complete len:174 (+),score=28.64 TRINITY_DN7536_c0_g1_i2:194-715(+)